MSCASSGDRHRIAPQIMQGFAQSFTAIVSGTVIGFLLMTPVQSGFNKLSKQICANSPDRVLIQVNDHIFGGTKLYCVPKRYA